MNNKQTQYHKVISFGHANDRVIEAVGVTEKAGEVFEMGYYNGEGQKKAIIAVSTATGCPVGCNFCDIRNSGDPLSETDIVREVSDMAAIVKKLDGFDVFQHPLKIDFSKTGDPTLTPHTLTAMEWLATKIPGISFKYSTSLPQTPRTVERIEDIARFAAQYKQGTVQLQLSLISTNEAFRQKSVATTGGAISFEYWLTDSFAMTAGELIERIESPVKLLPLPEVSNLVQRWLEINPFGRIPNGSLIVGEETPCDAREISSIFSPESIKFYIQPIVPTQHSNQYGIKQISDARIIKIIQDFRDHSFDISTSGSPTRTERENGLVSNVTRRRVLEGYYKDKTKNPKRGDIIAIPSNSLDFYETRRRVVDGYYNNETESPTPRNVIPFRP